MHKRTLHAVYERLPYHWKPVAYTAFEQLRYWRSQQDVGGFAKNVFGDVSRYESLCSELDAEPVSAWLDEAAQRAEAVRGSLSPARKRFESMYAYIRANEPELVVETGVRDGWSTLYTLAALRQNESGRLVSIDYPEADVSRSLPGGKEPGWIIPETLTDRWELRIGKSQRELPRVAVENEPIDVFLHDSMHDLGCMAFEFELAREHLSDGGLVFVDGVEVNAAFAHFVQKYGLNHGQLESYSDTNILGYCTV